MSSRHSPRKEPGSESTSTPMAVFTFTFQIRSSLRSSSFSLAFQMLLIWLMVKSQQARSAPSPSTSFTVLVPKTTIPNGCSCSSSIGPTPRIFLSHIVTAKQSKLSPGSLAQSLRAYSLETYSRRRGRSLSIYWRHSATSWVKSSTTAYALLSKTSSLSYSTLKSALSSSLTQMMATYTGSY